MTDRGMVFCNTGMVTCVVKCEALLSLETNLFSNLLVIAYSKNLIEFKVTMDKYGENLVNMIETNLISEFYSDVTNMLPFMPFIP